MKEIILFVVNLLANIKILTPINVAKLRFLYIMHKWPHFKNPRDLNEKINYLKFYGDTSKWPRLADKYAVRQYISDMGLGSILVKLYGKWDNVNEIDWDMLPNQFVMKCNNGSGDVLICKDKSTLNIESTKQYFDKMLHRKFGLTSGEPHYALIKPCIIAEELLDSSNQAGNSTSLIDYKIWCFNGNPHSVMVCYNRQQYHANVGVYDLHWQYHREYSIFTSHYKESKQQLPKPVCFEEMLKISRKLATGFPILRVDLYEVNGKVYFGELTFTSQSGCMDYFSQHFLNETGKLINL